MATPRRWIDDVSKHLVATPGKFKIRIIDKEGV